MTTGTLVCVGAGPKAVAVGAKAAVLAELGLPTPRVVAVEALEVGGNWLAGGGWTDGLHRLGTSPDKDVGFPYRSGLVSGLNREIDSRMLRYSWSAYLTGCGRFADYVDRGRPSPRHEEWARYLQWVARRTQLEVISGRVKQISVDSSSWVLGLESGDRVRGDALMITGPGDSGTALLGGHRRVLSVARFWAAVAERRLPHAVRAAVIGGGETAGSVLDELVRHDASAITVISPMPTLYTRGESYFENALYSDPTRWATLPEEQRRDVIRRTDRGVFSVRVQDAVLGDSRIGHLQGRVVRARPDGDLIALALLNGGRRESTHTFDLVVDATGGHPLWFLDLFDDEVSDLLELAVGWPVTQERIEAAIDYDLAVIGLRPVLHLPALAGPAQGPGFPNLSCLGVLADRVLRPAMPSYSAAARR